MRPLFLIVLALALTACAHLEENPEPGVVVPGVPVVPVVPALPVIPASPVFPIKPPSGDPAPVAVIPAVPPPINPSINPPVTRPTEVGLTEVIAPPSIQPIAEVKMEGSPESAAELPPVAIAKPFEQIKPKPTAMPWLKPAQWSQLPGWREDDLSRAWPALLQSCRGLRSNAAWNSICKEAQQQNGPPDGAAARTFIEKHFRPWQINQAEGGTEGLVTGYYEPLLRGSRTPSAKYRFPILGAPEDLLVVDLASIYPELKSLRLRGRIQGNKVVPYFTRSEIELGTTPLRGKELAWVDDPVDLFFLQVQGSGRVRLENGETLRVGYADQNGHPYRSIGKWLVEKGELTLDKASMQGIKDWGSRNPERLPELLHANPSYVFFRELPNNLAGPLGALGVPLTAERSIAIDPRGMPLGAPVWLATTRPFSSEALNRLMVAQDTGSAIRGNVRADFFWGFGEEAGKQAGSMKQKGRMWALLPKDYPILAANP
jgi:membrane-bound lytic murein transglycosylase A